MSYSQPSAGPSAVARGDIADKAALAGQDLSAGTMEWGRRPDVAPPFALTERDLRLMALLFDVNYLSASQLVMLGWGASARAARRRLKLLHDSGFLDRFRPVRFVGSAEWNYRVSVKGWAALQAREMVESSARYTPAALTSISYAEHDLQLAALLLRIAVEAGCESNGGLIDRMLFEWRGPRSGRIEWDSDDQFERSPAATLSPETRLHHEESRRGYLEPDATLIGSAGTARFAFLIEYDRTERPHKQTDRLRRYDWWLLDGWRTTYFATHAIPPTVIFLTAREQPLRRLVRTADKVFSAWHGGQHAGPREGTHAARERVFFTSRERILNGDWTMLQTPWLPPELLEQPRVCRAHSQLFNLASIFCDPFTHPIVEHDSGPLRWALSETVQARAGVHVAPRGAAGS